MAETRDPDGRRPGGGIGLPDHYRTWPAIKDRIFYTPEPRMLVGLGNGSPQPSRFRFDLGRRQHPQRHRMVVPIPRQ